MPPKKKATLIGNGMNANLLKQFIDYSYLGNTSIAPEGYSIDAPLSDSRVKVYTKNGSNDKNVVITHRGSVGLDDWMDNASYLFRGKVKGTKTYNLHRERHKKAVEKYGAKNIIAIGHSRAGLYLQELQKEFPIKENITYNKASGFFDIGRQNDPNQTDVRVGNDVVSLLAPLQKRPTEIVKIDGTKNPFDFNTAHQSSEIDKLGTTFIGKKEEMEGSGNKPILKLKTLDQLKKDLIKYEKQLAKIEKGKPYKTLTKESVTDLIVLTKERIDSYNKTGNDIDREKKADYSTEIPKKLTMKDRKDLAFILKPITEEIAVEDYKKLEKQKKKIPPMSSNDGNKFVDYFTFVERLNTKTKRGYTFYDFWENKDEEAKKNYFTKLFNSNSTKKGYETNIYDIFRLYFGSVNIFKPVIAMEIYNKYRPTSVLDPTMGWGGRLMGATILDVPKYTGIDLNPNLEKPYADMVEQIKKIGTKTKIKLFIPQDSLKVDYSKIDYDMVFTSPPYYNVEIYTGTKRVNKTKGSTIKKEWEENFYKPLFTKTWEHLKLGGHYVINVPKEVYNDVLLPLLGECDDKIQLRLSARKSKTYIEGKKEKEYGEFIYIWKKSDLKPLFYGEGIQPRISGLNQLHKLLGVEQRRLERMRKGTTKYHSKYITEPKTLEKISRLKERIKSAEKNQGHTTEDFFVPKTETWLKINKNDTYLNTPLKADGKHKLMLNEIDKRIEDIKAKKAKKTEDVIPEEPPKENIVLEVEEIKAEIKQEIKKVEAVVEAKGEEPKKKLTKEERKKARIAKKKEYDRLRYLQIKAKKLEQQTKATTTEKQVEKLEEKVETFKEEVKDFVEDLELDQEDIAKQLANMDEDEDEDEDEYVSIEVVKCKFKSRFFYLTLDNGVYIYSNPDFDGDDKFGADKYDILGYLHSDGGFFVTKRKYLYLKYFTFYPNKKSQYSKKGKIDLERIDYGDRSRPTLSFIFDKKTRQLEPYTNITKNQVETIEVPKAKYDEIMKKYDETKYIKLPDLTDKEVGELVRLQESLGRNLTDEEVEEMRKRLSGKGFNKKQLTQIILDKNKVISDLEETAYGGNYNQHYYLDNILDSNTTPQNLIIHREHINSVPKYIKSLNLEI